MIDTKILSLIKFFSGNDTWKRRITHFFTCSATVSGWGRTTRRRSSNSQTNLLQNKANIEVLQYLEVPIANNKCTGEGRNRIRIDPTRQICAGGEQGLFHKNYHQNFTIFQIFYLLCNLWYILVNDIFQSLWTEITGWKSIFRGSRICLFGNPLSWKFWTTSFIDDPLCFLHLVYDCLNEIFLFFIRKRQL